MQFTSVLRITILSDTAVKYAICLREHLKMQFISRCGATAPHPLDLEMIRCTWHSPCQLTQPLPVLYGAHCSLGMLSYYPVPLLRHASSEVLVALNRATATWLAMVSTELAPLVIRLLASNAAYMYIRCSNRHCRDCPILII